MEWDSRGQKYIDKPIKGDIKVDSLDYDVLYDAAQMIKGVPGLTFEIGLRLGGASKYIMDAMLANKDLDRIHVAIDPYGDIGYKISDEAEVMRYDYTNEMMKKTMAALYKDIKGKRIHFLFFPFEDIEYMRLFPDGLPVYFNTDKQIINQYALVYFDGPHVTQHVMVETEFFDKRAPIGSMFVYDDVEGYYNHNMVDHYLSRHGWRLIRQSTKKASYQKERRLIF